MTIAACYFSPEAIILGADSATTLIGPGGTFARHFNHAQKLFAVGKPHEATLGVVTWGLGEVGPYSHRTLINLLDRRLKTEETPSAHVAAEKMIDVIWPIYAQAVAGVATFIRQLEAKPVKTPQEQVVIRNLNAQFLMGYCVGGTWGDDNTPRAFEIIFEPLQTIAPSPNPLTNGRYKFWGCPTMIDRVLLGIDGELLGKLRASPHWTGTANDLDTLIRDASLNPPAHVPLREAVDFVHAAIYTTIRAYKFSKYPMICGGPIEIAAITSDRAFRWVCHKRLDEAIT
jgi:hypothetical protein